jgi:sugar/nucleoside kinase (ribokinase family)
MVIILGDLIADFSLRIARFPIQAQDLLKVAYIELGPGGATNVAISAARLGLAVACLGEVGDDRFGTVVLEGLQREGIDISQVVVTPRASTPVAGVIVDARGEPAYLGYPGSLQLTALPPAWRQLIQEAQALYADGWVEHSGGRDIILEAFRLAHTAGVPTFFDPGPGNPALDNAWHCEAAALATVLLATDDEASRLSGIGDPLTSARALLANGSQLVVIKRGEAGCLLLTGEEMHISPGFPVEARDTTGAGDSLAGAVIYGYLKGLPLVALGTLANATGAAKVQKLGTGHNMPTRAEVRAVLERFGLDPASLLPTPDKSGC